MVALSSCKLSGLTCSFRAMGNGTLGAHYSGWDVWSEVWTCGGEVHILPIYVVPSVFY